MLKRIISFLRRLFRFGNGKRRVIEEPGKRVIEEPGKSVFRNIYNKVRGKYISTRQYDFNMPKHQPCPECEGWRRRKFKAITGAGATYRCHHGEFFVSSGRTIY